MVVLLDGSFSSQLLKYVDQKQLMASPLWCAQYLKSNPEAVINVHSDYILAGSDVITTNTYQASLDGFRRHLGLDDFDGFSLLKEAVQLARTAIERSANGRNVLIAGSVGPYGACLNDGSEYNGDYLKHMTQRELISWHKPRVAALIEAKVDILALETMPSPIEATAILQLLKDEYSKQKAWVSFSCKDEKHVSHGELFRDAVAQCVEVNRGQLVAAGVNCLAPSLVTPLLKSAQGLFIPFIAYPNNGGTWTPGVGWSNTGSQPSFINCLPEWIGEDAKYVGGCCTTVAEDIRACREYIDSHQYASVYDSQLKAFLSN